MISTEVLQNDLLLNITGGSLGRCAVVPDDFERGNVSQHVCILRTVRVLPKYLHCFIISDYFSETMILSGSGREGLPKYSLEAMFIPLPPLAEQKRIVSAVEQWMSVIDVLENNEEDLRQSIDKAKSKILDLAIRGKLVPQDSNDEPASELLKRLGISPDNCPCEDLPFELPNGWCWTYLKDVSYQIGTKENQILAKDVQQNGLMPVVSQSVQIIDGYSDEINRKINNLPVILFGDHTRVVKFIDLSPL